MRHKLAQAIKFYQNASDGLTIFRLCDSARGPRGGLNKKIKYKNWTIWSAARGMRLHGKHLKF